MFLHENVLGVLVQINGMIQSSLVIAPLSLTAQ